MLKSYVNYILQSLVHSSILYPILDTKLSCVFLFVHFCVLLIPLPIENSIEYRVDVNLGKKKYIFNLLFRLFGNQEYFLWLWFIPIIFFDIFLNTCSLPYLRLNTKVGFIRRRKKLHKKNLCFGQKLKLSAGARRSPA